MILPTVSTNTRTSSITSKLKLQRAPKLGEILNLYSISKEVEQKLLFETTEKNYTMRMLESHIFPVSYKI